MEFINDYSNSSDISSINPNRYRGCLSVLCLAPYHSVRVFLDRIVDPMLAPIRRIVPAIGGMDFSPIVLIILLELIEFLILRLF